jgi:hypothetical protein
VVLGHAIDQYTFGLGFGAMLALEIDQEQSVGFGTFEGEDEENGVVAGETRGSCDCGTRRLACGEKMRQGSMGTLSARGEGSVKAGRWGEVEQVQSGVQARRSGPDGGR